MIRQQAFIEKNKMLRGNLHCHTTRTDGHKTPEDTIRYFKANGYDFLALTDHKLYNYINFAPETGLTIIPGMEFDADLILDDNQNKICPDDNGFRCFHTVCIGPLEADGNGYRQDEPLSPLETDGYDYSQDERVDAIYVRNQDEYQVYLDRIHEKKNLTVYCHPEWSSTPARYFDRLKGDFAIEVWNSTSAMKYGVDYDAPYWDELLGQGKRIWGVATDDCHEEWQFCNGWVMVNAQNNINDILCALESGAFYSSCGPVIKDFYIDGDKVVIECSPVAKIRLHSDKHPPMIVHDEDGNLTHAEFFMHSWSGGYDYVRMTIIDSNGKYAWTNPIFLK